MLCCRSFHLGAIGSFLCFGFISCCYSLVKFPRTRKRSPVALKQYFLVKPLLLSAVWIYLTLYLPAMGTHRQATTGLLPLTLIWFCWVFANSILFDIRDIPVDCSDTLAALLGKRRAHLLIDRIHLAQFVLIIFNGLKFERLETGFILMTTGFAFQLCNLYCRRRSHSPLILYIIADLTLMDS